MKTVILAMTLITGLLMVSCRQTIEDLKEELKSSPVFGTEEKASEEEMETTEGANNMLNKLMESPETLDDILTEYENTIDELEAEMDELEAEID